MITGHELARCPKCRAGVEYLHLKTAAPCKVRCGRCGLDGPELATQEEAVEAWNKISNERINV